ncbi:MAG: hypothetical protein GY720_04440 [bacterium]|nr:hypothetical protein [bacterium]
MPVIIVGADTPLGAATVDALLPRPSEVHAFVTSPDFAIELRSRGVKVALGDISDGSHLGGAALNAFCAVLIGQAATDERERSFATDRDGVLAAWADGLVDAGVKRIILVDDYPPPEQMTTAQAQFAQVLTTEREPAEVAQEITALEDAAQLP